jgi:uncharacterized iron-regulated membrane protein
VFIVSITGCLYVFKDEFQNYFRSELIHHREANFEQKAILPLREMEAKVVQQVAEKYPLHWVEIPMDKSLSYKFHYYESNPNAWNYFDELVIYETVYVNPFSGKVLGVEDEKHGFFNIVKFIHWSLLLKSEWGTYIIGIPILIFVVLLITGIILWWPKNKNARKQRFSFQWKNGKSWKRKNYDVHSILGFYASFVALIISITGLYYSFFVVQAAIYFVFSGGNTQMPDFSHIHTKAPIELRTTSTIDKIAAKVEQVYPNASTYTIDLGHPHLDDHEHENFSIFVKELGHSYHINHSLIFDENSGELLHTHAHKDKNLGEKAIAANYDIHVGSIFGLPTKILAFLASLICASLPITGFMIWYGRRKKAKK